jgi:hypothetical protein
VEEGDEVVDADVADEDAADEDVADEDVADEDAADEDAADEDAALADEVGEIDDEEVGFSVVAAGERCEFKSLSISVRIYRLTCRTSPGVVVIYKSKTIRGQFPRIQSEVPRRSHGRFIIRPHMITGTT